MAVMIEWGMSEKKLLRERYVGCKGNEGYDTRACMYEELSWVDRFAGLLS